MALSLGLSALITAVPKLEQLHSYSFAAYEQDFGKIYATQAERDHRASVFANNLATIVAHNAKYRSGNSSYWMNVNTFADLTNEEFRARRTGTIHTRCTRSTRRRSTHCASRHWTSTGSASRSLDAWIRTQRKRRRRQTPEVVGAGS